MENQEIRQKTFPLLQVTDVCCIHRRHMLLDHVSFSLNSGESLGILGLRQSGKSLLLQVLAGAVRINQGTVQLKGFSPRHGKNFYSNIGLVTEKASLFTDLRVSENLDLIYHLKQVKDPHFVDTLLERLDLKSYLKERAGALPPGPYQRLALACALVNQPALLLLDDVLHGIDSFSLTLIQDEIQHFLATEGTLIWVVHLPDDLASVQYTAWMEEGRLEILPEATVRSRWHTPNFHRSTEEAGDKAP